MNDPARITHSNTPTRAEAFWLSVISDIVQKSTRHAKSVYGERLFNQKRQSLIAE